MAKPKCPICKAPSVGRCVPCQVALDDVVAYVVGYCEEYGWGPSTGAVADHFGLSLNRAGRYLEAAKEEGRLSNKPPAE